jgi:adenylate kinase family enzyme
MTSLVRNLKGIFARLSLTFKLACLIAFVAMLLSYNHRSLLRSLATRLYYFPKTKPVIVFAIGNPSTDKDTFIANLARDFDFHHVFIGPWLSSLRERQDQVGALARRYWEKQVPMPANHLVPLLRAHINELRDHNHNRFLIDGFPRTRESAETWERRVGKPELVVYFETPQRRASKQYAGVVRKRFDSVSGDDERKFVEQRFQEHEKETSRLMDLLKQGGRTVKVRWIIITHLLRLLIMPQINAPDDTNKSYAKVVDALRGHPHGAKVFGLVDDR